MNLVTRRRVGAVIWGAGVLVALVWGGLRNVKYEARGIGYALPVHVSPLETGRIASLEVDLHDTVGETQVVVKLDPSVLEEEKAVVSARLLAVQDEQAAAAANLARRFAEGVEDTMLDSAKLRAQIESDRALVASLSEQLAIEKGLQDRGASSNQQVRSIERDLEVAQARLDATRRAYGSASAASSAATARKEGIPLANEWHVVAASRELEQVEGRLGRLDLAAGIEGQVTQIFHTQGDVVQPGDVVMTITKSDTSEVVAWLPSAATTRALAGSKAHVVRASGEVIRGSLVSVGSGIQQMPPQLWTNPAHPEWGLPVRIELAEGNSVGPSEAVTVRI